MTPDYMATALEAAEDLAAAYDVSDTSLYGLVAVGFGAAPTAPPSCIIKRAELRPGLAAARPEDIPAYRHLTFVVVWIGFDNDADRKRATVLVTYEGPTNETRRLAASAVDAAIVLLTARWGRQLAERETECQSQ